MKHLTPLLICFSVFITSVDVAAQAPTFANVPYVTDGGERQQLDVYLPNNYREIEKLPVIVWIHGGGWNGGGKGGMPGKEFLNQGYACDSINHRYVSQTGFPAPIEDCKAIIRWLRANAKTYHFDPDRIGVWGASSGGHLAALLGTTSHKKVFDVGENLDQSSAVQAVCDIYGPTDFVIFFAGNPSWGGQVLGGPLAKGKEVAYFAEKKELATLVSPMTHVSKENPPILILHGSNDTNVPVSEGKQFYEALKKAGVDVEIDIVEGAGHDGAVYSTQEQFKKISDFFDKHLKNKRNL
jgi:acetyl esterase/lipase